MRAGLQNAKLLGFGPIGLCPDTFVRFAQMLQCLDVFALVEILAVGEVFLLIFFGPHEACSEAVINW